MRRLLALGSAALLLATGLAAPAEADEGSVAAESVWLQRRVLNVAHAGGDLEAPHSTLFAMKTAVASGTDVLEMDVRLSSDGVLMVHHDETVDRTTEATGPMASLTAAQLQALDNAYWFVPNCWSCRNLQPDAYQLRGIRSGDRPAPTGFGPDDFRIPTLADVAAAFPDRILDVEIKDGPTGLAAAEQLAAFIAADGRPDRFLVASFDDSIIEYFASLAPDVATSPGLGATTEWFLADGSLEGHDVLQVPPVFSGIPVVTQEFVDRAHAEGIAVWVWFNGNDDDSPAEWQRLIDLGVDALLTGKPAAAQDVIDANSAAYSSAPVLGATTKLRGRSALIDFSCPAAHVATCSSRLVAVAQNPAGEWVLVGDVEASTVRGTTTSVRMRTSREGQRLLRAGPVQVFVWMPALNGDTANTIRPTTLTRG